MNNGMEYLFVLAMLVLAVILFFVRGMLAQRRLQRELVKRLHKGYGGLPDKNWKPECYDNLDWYHNWHGPAGEQGAETPEGAGNRHEIDDITWNDLEMDRVFLRLDYTMSRAGVEYLYHTLRTPVCRESKQEDRLEEQIVYFMGHEEERIRLQLLLKGLGRMEKYSLYQYLEQLDLLGKRENTKHHLGNLFYLLSGGLFFMNQGLGLVCLLLTAAVNIGNYLREKQEIEPYLSSFSYILGLMRGAKIIRGMDWDIIRTERETILQADRKLKKFSRGAGLVVSASATGNPAELLFDYLRMLFHIDLIFFNRMYREVMQYRREIDELFGTMGYLDTVISIGAFRASLPYWCVPQLGTQESWQMEEGYHPLLENPVAAGITAFKGVLITGSNASGKSTFLKTCALNALLAQTIHTAAAKGLRMCRVRLYSSMALRDDMGAGESYYIVEIKAIKRILDAARGVSQGQPPVLCFVDEVLRGTNTVERIAASTQVLKGLNGPGVRCFAATHDIELCGLLEEDYDNYHFEEEVSNGDVLFSYQLQAGRAVTRNAIRLLEVMGYDERIVEMAQAQAEVFLETGEWKLPAGNKTGSTDGEHGGIEQ